MDMSDSANVATTVGIWVAVVVVVVAIVGVGGPLLVYKVSKTERHQALSSVRDSDGYITQGLRLSKSVRILRQVKAPILAYEPDFNPEEPDPNVGRPSKAKSARAHFRRFFEAIKEQSPRDTPNYHGDTPLQLDTDAESLGCRSTTSWVRLGKLLEAYPQLSLERGDTLRIEKNQTFLPVHRLWILTFGLVGRYGKRSEDSIVSRSARPRDAAAGVDPVPAQSAYHALGGPPFMQPTDAEQCLLRGITGAIFPCRDGSSSSYIFSAHDKPYLQGIIPDKLSLRSLFWLALGAIPRGEGEVYSMIDLETPKTWTPSRDGFDDNFPASTESNGGIAMTSLTRPAHEANNNRHPSDSRALRRCRFVRISGVSGLPFDILHRFGGGRQTVFGLEEVPLDSPEASTPADTWVTLPGRSPDPEPEWQLRRPDAQFLARRLLGLNWNAEGYLFGRHRATRLWRFLSAAAADLHNLLVRARQHLDLIGETEADRARLREVLDQAIPASDRQDLDRAGTAALFAAHAAFEDRLGRDRAEKVVGELVGVLVLTDAEFRALVAQSSRHLGAAAASSSTIPTATAFAYASVAPGAVAPPDAARNVVTFDRRASAVLVPSAFGVRQAFVVDLERLYHANGTTQKFFREEGRDVIEAGLRVVILAALRACCVSALLRGAWSSEALFRFLGQCPEGVVFS